MFFIFKTILAIVVFSVLSFFLFFTDFKSEEIPEKKVEAPVTTLVAEEVKEKTVELKLKKELEFVEEIKNPLPLQVVKKEEVKKITSLLTVPGTISWTNFFRQIEGISPLKESTSLNFVAQSKVSDMLNLQYFEHVSPSGEEASDLAHKHGYSFLLIGENLAMGDFENDEDMVRAWMDSPGHKANILKPSYTEIGVAVKKGLFKEREVWLGVQIFAIPLSSCKTPEKGLLEKIESNKAQLKSTREHLNLLKSVIEEEKYQTKEEYEKIVAEYNFLVPSYNFLSQDTKSLIEKYNYEASLFNQCVDLLN